MIKQEKAVCFIKFIPSVTSTKYYTPDFVSLGLAISSSMKSVRLTHVMQIQYVEKQKVHPLCYYLRNHSNSDIGVFGYIDVN